MKQTNPHPVKPKESQKLKSADGKVIPCCFLTSKIFLAGMFYIKKGVWGPVQPTPRVQTLPPGGHSGESRRAIGDRSQINLLFVLTKQTNGSTNNQASDGHGNRARGAWPQTNARLLRQPSLVVRLAAWFWVCRRAQSRPPRRCAQSRHGAHSRRPVHTTATALRFRVYLCRLSEAPERKGLK
jgi:hypothetical protein